MKSPFPHWAGKGYALILTANGEPSTANLDEGYLPAFLSFTSSN
jgi:hypothetical protein